MTHPDTSAAFWEHRYQHSDPGWGIRPNSVIERVIPTVAPTPGTALDLGCGHGGDALWLAQNGWHVTAVDVSPTAIQRVTDRARDLGLGDRITAIAADIVEWLPNGSFDLVTASFVHTSTDRNDVLRRASELVAPGGMLVVIDHASVAPWSWKQDAAFPTPAETLRGFGLGQGWAPVMLEAASRIATGPGGQTAPVVENVIVARRG